RDFHVTGVQTCALPISASRPETCCAPIWKVSARAAANRLGTGTSRAGRARRIADFALRPVHTLDARDCLRDAEHVRLYRGWAGKIGRASCRERGAVAAG